MSCKHCSMSFVDVLKFSEHDILTFYVNHGNYFRTRKCGLCSNTLVLNEFVDWMFRCNKILRPTNTNCQFTISAKRGTLFDKAHVSMCDFFNFVATVLSVPHPRGKFMKQNFNFSKESKVNYYGLMREVFIDNVSENQNKLGGEGNVVELYEAKFGKPKKIKGKNIEADWAYGGIDLKINETFLVPVEKRDKETVLRIVQEKIKPNTTIVSNFWKDHDCHSDESFVQETVTKSIQFVDPENYKHIKTILRQWRHVEDRFSRIGWRNDHNFGQVAEYLFKIKYSNLNDRIHHFWIAAANLYPPEK